MDSPAASPAEAAAANQAEGPAKKKGYTPQKVDPQIFSKALWVGWQEVDDPPLGELDAGLLGGILRDKFGDGLSSISDAQLNHKAMFTIVGVKPVDYDKGMKLTRHHTARGWKVSWAESKMQPYTPWAPDQGDLEAKHQRRYSPRRSDRSPSRRRSPGHHHDSPPPRRRGAYRDERSDPREHPSRHVRHAAAPVQPYPYSGDHHNPRVATHVSYGHSIEF